MILKGNCHLLEITLGIGCFNFLLLKIVSLMMLYFFGKHTEHTLENIWIWLLSWIWDTFSSPSSTDFSKLSTSLIGLPVILLLFSSKIHSGRQNWVVSTHFAHLEFVYTFSALSRSVWRRSIWHCISANPDPQTQIYCRSVLLAKLQNYKLYNKFSQG